MVSGYELKPVIPQKESLLISKQKKGSVEHIKNTAQNKNEAEQGLIATFNRQEVIDKKASQAIARKKFLVKVAIAISIAIVILLILDLLCIYLWKIEFRNPTTKQLTGYKPYVTVDIIVIGIVLMCFDFPPDAVMISVDFLYLITQCQSFQQTTQGFANTGILTVVFLCIASQGINQTKALQAFLKKILGNSKILIVGLLRLLICVFILSAFVNNTALVGIFIPLIQSWCITNALPVRAFLLPLSITSILGGACTYIGSTVSLIGFQLATENPQWKKGDTISFFEVGAVGLPVGVIGLIYLLIFSGICLNPRKQKSRNLEEQDKLENQQKNSSKRSIRPDQGYWIAMEVTNLKGETPVQIGMHNITLSVLHAIIKVNSLEVIQGENEINNQPLNKGDLMLYFCHSASGVVAVRQFKSVQFCFIRPLARLGEKRRYRVLFELIVSKNSSLQNTSPRQCDFLYKYDACILGVKREGVGICRYSYDNLKIKSGDCLLVEAPASKHSQYKQHFDFSLCSVVPNSKPPRQTNLRDFARQLLAILLFLVMIFFSIFNVLDIGISAFFISLIFVLNKTLTLDEAKAASNADIYIILAASIGVGNGLKDSGAMSALGSGLLSAGESGGVILVIFLIYLCTMVISLVLSTSGTAIIMMPIAFQAADATGYPQKLFVFIIVLAAMAGFSTPFSYQTNLMVWKPGGYKFCDYIVVGIPLNVILLVVTTFLAYYIYGKEMV